MAAVLEYLQDTSQTVSRATVTGSGRDERGAYFALDRTIFYPQGGGQPSDVGTARGDGAEWGVTFAAWDGTDVRHYVAEGAEPPADGTQLDLEIDGARRAAGARAHSAGHLICSIVETEGPSHGWNLRGAKGYHFPDGPYVEFEGAVPADLDALAAWAGERLAQVTAQGLPVAAETGEGRTADGKPLRTVRMGDFPPVPCGGTHVVSTKELAGVRVTKAKAKAGRVRVSYAENPSK